MKNMVKTQVYLPPNELKELHLIAKQQKRRLADLVREAIRKVWFKKQPTSWPVGLSQGRLRGSSCEHDSAFDET